MPATDPLIRPRVRGRRDLGRESFGLGEVIKELVQARVEVWSSMDQKSMTPRNAMDKAMFSLRSFGTATR